MTKSILFSRDDLANLKPEYTTFVGIDSDGCVFDTMEIKQKQCFHKLIVAHWHLEPIEKLLRETAEFVNLYSRHRGRNRFLSLLLTFDLLGERPEVKASGITLPEFKALKEFCGSGLPLANSTLEKNALQSGNAELAAVLEWSKAVDRKIEKTLTHPTPFAGASESLRQISAHSDAICVSQTPTAALVREWRQHGLLSCVKAIAGQELGAKSEHLRLATAGRYQDDNILMIGDAPGDLAAARENKAHFYPINPGHEARSWERFHQEAYTLFLRNEYGGHYESSLIEEFDKLLPATAPWK